VRTGGGRACVYPRRITRLRTPSFLRYRTDSRPSRALDIALMLTDCPGGSPMLELLLASYSVLWCSPRLSTGVIYTWRSCLEFVEDTIAQD
jgi:hypothetical protein